MRRNSLFSSGGSNSRQRAAEKLAQHERVESAEWIETTYAVVLRRGWRDSGITTGEHTVMDRRVSDVMTAIRLAVPCECEQRCKPATNNNGG